MTKRDESFHPRLIIYNHFDALINRIDVKTEELLQVTIKFQNGSNCLKKMINDLNELREKQIEKIKQVK